MTEEGRTGKQGRERALVAMSGGVDSSVCAALMQEAGYDCIGVNMRLFSAPPAERGSSSCSVADAYDARQVAEGMGLPFYVLPCNEAFEQQVVQPFVREYLAGRTPNPCVECNRCIKFDLLLERAKRHGCTLLATGHYARVSFDAARGRYVLKKARDKSKDQSYVLYMLTQETLSGLRFPLGDYTKEEVRALAAEYGFVNAKKPESQDICFVAGGDYASFIEAYTGKRAPEGNFVTQEGKVLGRHRGLIRYTTGQRRGLSLSSERPWYVKELRPASNEVVLARKEALVTGALIADRFNWLSIAPPAGSIRAQVQTRYRQAETPARVTPLPDGRAEIVFDAPKSLVTKGQAVVLYDGEEVLGGGTICEIR